ncbi:MAG: recombination protein RecR [Dehalococcoidia bacterium]|nr:recombination protein RecR [Dehalococcoidia bacterium]MQG16560.1 recombination protein RecR [SAR202 cluster bacterium]
MNNGPIERLVTELHKLPGIGPKTAQRLAYYLVRVSKDDASKLADSINAVKEKIDFCSACFDITENDPCPICSNPNRDKTRICVVEEPLDVRALEKTRSYTGTYHVLHGVISPMNDIGPDDLRIDDLLRRMKLLEVEEIIIATNPNVEGEATALYIQRLLEPFEVKITRPARGLPVGGDLEYADEITLSRAMEGRQPF